MTRFGITRVAAVAALGLFVTAAAAQPPADPIEAAKARQRILDQKVEAEVVKALQDAERQAKTNPAKAAQTLRAAQNNIDLAVGLSGDTRKTLTTLLQGKIAAIEGRPAPNMTKLDPNGATVKADKQAAFEAMRTEVREVGEGVEYIKKLQVLNRNAEADQVIATLAKKYPDNPAVIALTEKGAFANRVADSQLFARNQSDRIVYALNDVAKSSLPPKGDVEFPPNWKDGPGKRKYDQIELTAKEKSIISALDKAVNVSFNGRPLEECLQDLSNLMGESLFLDTKSLGDLGVDLKKPVNLDAKGISARTVLRQILGSQGLTFVVKGEAIQVVTVEKARDMLVTRVYYLGDVIKGVGPFGGGAINGPFLDYQQTMANAELIVNAIKDGIDPLSWRDKGGPCTVTFHYPSMSLIIRASSEVHATLGSKLGGGR
jgi:hypothetical protein